MDKEFIEKMKLSLQELKTELIHNLIDENSEFKELVEDLEPKDVADIAADDIDKKTLEAIGTQTMKRLKLIDSALSRAQNGKYGICIKCGKRISQPRLEAIPYALMCIECKTREERQNR